MKFFMLSFCIAFLACAYAAAVSHPEDPGRDDIAALETRDIETIDHPDGRQELKVYEEGTYEGSIFVGAEGELQAFDVDGEEIPASELDADGPGDDGAAIHKRWIPVALRIAWVLARQGIKAGTRLYKRMKPWANCVGHQLLVECSLEWAQCVDAVGISVSCIQGSACLGKQGIDCAKLFL